MKVVRALALRGMGRSLLLSWPAQRSRMSPPGLLSASEAPAWTRRIGLCAITIDWSVPR